MLKNLYTKKHRENLCNKLLNQAYDLLDNRKYNKAIQIGKKLKNLGFSGAYEILAEAHYKKDNIDKAIKILKKGVNEFPSVHILWKQLGNYLKRIENYEEAMEAYQTALKCPKPNYPSIYLNAADCLYSQDKYKEALKYCDMPVDNFIYRIKLQTLKVELLKELEYFDEAYQLAESLINEIKKENEVIHKMLESGEINLNDLDDDLNPELSKLYSYLAEMNLIIKKDRINAIEYIKLAIKADRYNKNAMFWLREIKNKYSPLSIYFYITVEGKFKDKQKIYDDDTFEEREGFYTFYDVIADNTEEALEYISEFEGGIPGEQFSSLKIEHVTEITKSPDQPEQPHGIYKTYGRILF